MTPISARSRRSTTVAAPVPSRSARAAVADSTGVLPDLTTSRGPRTAAAGFDRTVWPVTSQSKSIRIAARCCLTLDGPSTLPRFSTYAATIIGSTASKGTPISSHHAPNRRTAAKYARRVLALRMLTVKNSKKRRANLSSSANIAGGPMGRASTRAAGALGRSPIRGLLAAASVPECYPVPANPKRGPYHSSASSISSL